jgi:predicted nucleic acid-binding protein
MTPSPFACVVDASVAVQMVVPEPLSPIAIRLFQILANDPSAVFHAPDLFYAECANVLWQQVRRGHASNAAATQAMTDLCALRLTSVPTANLALEALNLALTHSISAYDGCYLALSQRHKVPLITADQKLVGKLSGTSHPVVWLGAWTPPAATP